LSSTIPGSSLTYRVHVKNNDGRHVHDIKTENNEKRRKMRKKNGEEREEERGERERERERKAIKPLLFI